MIYKYFFSRYTTIFKYFSYIELTLFSTIESEYNR